MSKREKSFPPTHVRSPTSVHTHTAIMLHGRGSTGLEFAEELFSARLSQSNEILPALFPTWRWVFPSSPTLWSTAFQGETPAWFEVPSLADITTKQEQQADGITASVEYLLRILDGEVVRLKGAAE